MEKIKPKPPEPLGVKQPSLNLPPKDYRDLIMSFKFSDWKSKTILRSRTILTVVLTILGFIGAKFFGLDIDLGSVKADLSKPSGG